MSDAPKHPDIASELAWLLDPRREDGALSAGDLAELRRMEPETGNLPPAFWRLLTMKALVKADETQERAVAVLIRTMAQPGVLGADPQPVGRALAESKYAEQRFVRLLRARDLPTVAHEARLAAQWCAGKGHHLRFAGARQGDRFGRFIIDAAQGHDAADHHAHAIARDYFAQQSHDERANTPAESAP
jgi:hypothetical protein